MAAKSLFSVVLFCLAFSMVQAGNSTFYSSMLTGTLWKDNFQNPNYSWNLGVSDPDFRDYDPYFQYFIGMPGTKRAFISLKVDLAPVTKSMMPNKFVVVAKFQYFSIDTNKVNGSPVTDSLEVTYDPSHLSLFKDISELEIPVIYPKINVTTYVSYIRVYKIVGNNRVLVTSNDLNNDVTKNYISWSLQTRVEIEKYKIFLFSTATDTAITVTYNEDYDNIYVGWNYFGTDEYELEYQFIDDYGFSYSSLSYNFRKNSTRVRTQSNRYSIPLAYEQGYLVFRIRGVTKNPDDAAGGYNQPYYTNWSAPDYGMVQSVRHYHIASDHQPEINWQLVSTFAEDARRMDQVTYLDGTLRARQQVQRPMQVCLSEEGVCGYSNVTEMLYDYLGRKAVSILPSPVQSSKLTYFPLLNTNSSGNPYGKDEFENLDSSLCLYSATALLPKTNGNLSGASNYFSNYCWDLGSINTYPPIPQAGGYPFSQTRYTNDNTGRPRAVSLPGGSLSMGSSHETRYYYGVPGQIELDRLFGNEAGYAMHYKKNMVVDPNGEVTLSYLDLKGNTIATALAGNLADSLEAIETNEINVETTDNLLDFNRIDTLDYSLISERTLLIPATGNYLFDYTITPEEFNSLTCKGDSVCYDCGYDLIISIFNDDCPGDTVFYGSIFIGNPFVTNKDSVTRTCVNSVEQEPFEKLETKELKQGSYTITKKLKVNPGVAQLYQKDFIKDTCQTVWDQIFKEEMDKIDTLGCNRACLSCLDSVQSMTDYEHLTPQQIAFLDECFASADCDTASINMCDAVYEAMITDVSPYGQYAEIELVDDIVSVNSELSVFNRNSSTPLNHLPMKYLDGTTWKTDYLHQGADNDWKQQDIHYHEDDGTTLSYIQLLTGEFVFPQDAGIDEFIEKFQASWAKDLVPLHPEYCYYQWCKIPYVDASYDHNTSMVKTRHYDDALSAGYLNYPSGDIPMSPDIPDSVLNMFYNAFIAKFSSTHNPITQNNTFPFTGTTRTFSSFTDSQNFEFINTYLKKAALVKAFCSSCTTETQLQTCVSSHTFGADADYQDQEWIAFRAFYQSVKETYLFYFRSDYAIDHKCFNNCIGNSDYSETQYGFNHSGNNYNDNQPCYTSNAGYYQHITKRFPGANDTPGIGNNNVYGYEYHTTSLNNTALPNIDQSYLLDTLQQTMQDSINSIFGGLGINRWPLAIISGSKWLDLLRGLIVTDNMFGNYCFTGTNTYSTVLLPGKAYASHLVRDRYQDTLQVFHSNSPTNACYHPYFQKYDPGNAFCAACDTGSCMPDCCVDQVFLQYNLNQFDPNLPSQVIEWNNIVSLDTIVKITPDQALLFNYYTSPTDLRRDNEYYLNFYRIVGKYDPNIEGITELFPIRLELVAAAFPGCYDVECVCDPGLIKNCDQPASTNIQISDIKDFMENIVNSDFLENPNPYNQHYPLPNQPNNLSQSVIYNYDTLWFEGNPAGKTTAEFGWYHNHAEIACSKFLITRELWFDWSNINEILDIELIPPTELDLKPWDLCDTSQTGPWDYYRIKVRVSRNPPPDVRFGYLELWRKKACFCNLQSTICHYDTTVIFHGPVLEGTVAVDTVITNNCNGCLPEYPRIPLDNPCISDLVNTAYHNAEIRYQAYMDSLSEVFLKSYMRHCLAASERFSVTYNELLRHYTLYYYDQANNLVKTVPPRGIDLEMFTDEKGQEILKQIMAFRLFGDGDPYYPSYELVSSYQYNSLNQVINQSSPDAGVTKFAYDELRRLILSQNARQEPTSTYTYYDDLNRIFETGEIHPPLMPASGSVFPYAQLVSALGSQNYARNDITRTYYDKKAPYQQKYFDTKELSNLRGRVTGRFYHADTTNISLTDSLQHYDWATYYSYDIAGNVKTLIQAIPMLTSPSSLSKKVSKRMDYEYDQISGKVNRLVYQKNQWDQFIHRYSYDIRNRLSKVETSNDGHIWDIDAQYFYHEYGPLARVEYGTEKVQGMDYAYTIQGWLKVINSGHLNAAYDMGRDGNSSVLQVNHPVGRDVFGEVLGYFKDDFTPARFNNGVPSFNYDPSRGIIKNQHGLYNGNIPQMWDGLAFPWNTDSLKVRSMLHTYRYDELNRLVEQSSYNYFPDSVGLQNPLIATNNYFNTFTYDANGNIISNYRRGCYSTSTPLEMDNLGYEYHDGTNRLSRITDLVSSGNYPSDLDNQTDASNYVYDATGNLIQDKSERNLGITWNIANKPVALSKTNPTWAMYYYYDPMGNRVVKHENSTNTVYVRDASGNILAVYAQSSGEDTIISLKNSYIYGSSRLGELDYGDRKYEVASNKRFRERGRRHYELCNHLGNVMGVVTDRKHMVDTNGDRLWEYNLADVYGVSDYYPGGMLMPGRSYSSNSYRFGFNGKENDNEVKGTGNQQDYGMRIYDPRIIRFNSVDPLTASYPMLTPYQFASNRMIDGVDRDGKEYITYIFNVYNETGAVLIDKIDYRDVENFNYKMFSQSFGPEGRGVKFVYNYYNSQGDYEKQQTRWEQWQGTFSKDLATHGMFYGEGCVTVAGPRFDSPYAFWESPVDMTDAIAKEHDIQQSNENVPTWTDPGAIFSDIVLVKRLDEFIKQASNADYIDPFTGRKPSLEALNAASNASEFFKYKILANEVSMLYKRMTGKLSKAEYRSWRDKVKEVKRTDVELPSN